MSEELPELHPESLTMRDAVRAWAELPAGLIEWGRLLLAYPEERESLDAAFAELDEGPRTTLDIVRVLRARMDSSVRDPATGRAVPGPHHPAPGERP